MNESRNYGIDLFKLFAMFQIVMLHVIGAGGVLISCKAPAQSNVAWFLEIIAYCGVDCFALASGYLKLNSKFKPQRLLELWLTVVFYGLFFTALFSLVNKSLMPAVSWKTALLPVTSNEYWYFTAYFVLFLLSPFVNYILKKMKFDKLTFLLITLFILFSIVTAVTNRDLFQLQKGYSVIWLLFMYFIGGYIRRFNIEKAISKKVSFTIFFCSVLITSLIKNLIDYYSTNYLHKDISEQIDIATNYFGQYVTGNVCVTYVFPLIVISSIMLLVFFSGIQVKNRFLIGRIEAYAPLVFSIYLIHTNPLVYDNVISGLFSRIADYNSFLIIIFVLLSAAAVYAICIMIDILRFEFFKLIRVNKFCQFITNKMTNLFYKIMNSEKISKLSNL